MATENNIFERRLLLLSFIKRAPKSSSTKQLAASMLAHHHDLSERQVQKELVYLMDNTDLGIRYYVGDWREVPPPFKEVYVTRKDKQTGKEIKVRSNQPRYWYIDQNAAALDLVHMDTSAALIMKLAERYLNDLLPRAIFQNVEHFFHRADEVLAKATSSQRWLRSVSMVSKSLQLLPPTFNESVIEKVYQGLQQGKQLRVKSRTRQSPTNPREYLINPLGLVTREGLIYLVWCSAEGGDKVKEFALHRLTEAEVLDDACVLPSGFTLDGFINEERGFSYLVQPNELPHIDFEFLADKDLAFKLSETPLDMTQRIGEPDADGWSRVTAHVPYTHQLMAWIREQGYNIRVLGPQPLLDEMVSQIRQMAALYEDEG